MCVRVRLFPQVALGMQDEGDGLTLTPSPSSPFLSDPYLLGASSVSPFPALQLLLPVTCCAGEDCLVSPSCPRHPEEGKVGRPRGLFENAGWVPFCTGLHGERQVGLDRGPNEGQAVGGERPYFELSIKGYKTDPVILSAQAPPVPMPPRFALITSAFVGGGLALHSSPLLGWGVPGAAVPPASPTSSPGSGQACTMAFGSHEASPYSRFLVPVHFGELWSERLGQVPPGVVWLSPSLTRCRE